MYSVATYIEEFGTRVEEMKNLPGKSSELARGVMYIESAGGKSSFLAAISRLILAFRCSFANSSRKFSN